MLLIPDDASQQVPIKRRTGDRSLNSFARLLAGVQTRIAHWQQLCEQYLPVASDDPMWRLSRAPTAGDLEQGWKLHVSATILSANKVFARVAPALCQQDILFKAPCSLEELGNLNGGQAYGFSQVGKFITIYPRDTEEAVSLARQLHRLTHGLTGPAVPFDLCYRPNSLIHYRYGCFGDLAIQQPDGQYVRAIRDLEGQLVPDLRAPGAAVPPWLPNPFLPARQRQRAAPASLLKTTYRAYDVLCQRGRGGIYRALDLSALPVRHCILKEGRRYGETAWDGRDGHWRLKHESEVLKALAQAGVNVPQSYATFQSGHHLYLAMELIEGKNLQTFLQEKSRRLGLAAAFDYGAQLARLLAAIHQAGWVWRDCKPQNLMRTNAGVLRPVDFEGACPVARPDLLPWGTPGYAPPEWGRVPDQGSRLPEDLFALGATLHQLITGRLPEENVVAPPVQQLRRCVPLSVREVIRALLDPSPQLRPAAWVVAGLLQEACMAVATASKRHPPHDCARDEASGERAITIA